MFTCNTIHPSPENNHDELHRSSNQPAPPTVPHSTVSSPSQSLPHSSNAPKSSKFLQVTFHDIIQRICEKIEYVLLLGGTKKDIVLLILSGIALLCSMIFPSTQFPNPAWLAILLCGVPILIQALIGLVTAFDIKADVLVSLALIASVWIGEIFAAGEVAFIMQLGALLEELTVAKTRAGIEKLVHLTPQTAWRISANNTETEIPAQEVVVGDLLRVHPGQTIPVDGVIIDGQTSINQAVMTGESLPVDKTVGDEVLSGTVNQFGAFDMCAKKVGEDSSIQRMIRLVQSADAGKAKIVRLADRWATWIVVIALTVSALTWLITGNVIRAVTILVVFCPCALVLATPTAIMAAIGNVTKHGFLVRQGDALERLANVRKIAFDKTGTLTCGVPHVTAVYSVHPVWDNDTLFTYLAAAEQFSEHPLGKAVTASYRDMKKPMPSASDFIMIPGKGIVATVEGKRVLAGNQALLSQSQIVVPEKVLKNTTKDLQKGCTVIYIAIKDTFAGYAVLSDTIRKESAHTIDQMKALGIIPVLLTGDHQHAAMAMGKELHLNEIHAACLPQDKLRYIEDCQSRGESICMIGDGINDAPALKKAMVGIAMGGVGSDIAVDAADIVLVDDEMKELPHLLALSRRMMRTIRCNLIFSMALNFLAITLAIIGTLSPISGALVHNAGSVIVICNAACLLRWKRKNIKTSPKQAKQ